MGIYLSMVLHGWYPGDYSIAAKNLRKNNDAMPEAANPKAGHGVPRRSPRHAEQALRKDAYHDLRNRPVPKKTERGSNELTKPPRPAEQPKRECVFCFDSLPSNYTIKSPCTNKHSICHDCLKRMALMCIKDESMYPPKCCKQRIAQRHIQKVLGETHFEKYKEASREYEAVDRLYCPNHSCGRFVAERMGGSGASGYARCRHCETEICTYCKNLHHPGIICDDDDGAKELLEMARANNWKRCPRCRDMVEKLSGCWFVRCRCGGSFCFICGQVFDEFGVCGGCNKIDVAHYGFLPPQAQHASLKSHDEFV